MASRAPSHVAANESQLRPTWLHLQEIKQLIALLNGSDLSEIHIEYPDHHLKLDLRKPTLPLSSSGDTLISSTPQILTTDNDPLNIEKLLDEGKPVHAELVGRFHSAQKRDARPLAQVGDVVHEGQVIGYIETLHVMNEVESTINGRVSKILIADGQPIEYGQAILLIEPAPEGNN